MAPPGTSGLSVRIGTDLEALSDDLAARLSTVSHTVLAREVIVVPTPGIGLWLEARLASRLGATELGDGISANLDLILLGDLLRRVTGRPRNSEDPWSIGRMTVSALAALTVAPPADPVASLRPSGPGARLFAVARSCADLFDQLFRWRPDVADSWLADGVDDPRAALLRTLAAATAMPPPHHTVASTVDRLLAGDDGCVDLPARVHLFGYDSLPGGPQFPRLLSALGAVRELCVHLVVPSVEHFEDAVTATPHWPSTPPARPRDAIQGGTHPLLRSWGAASRDAAAMVAQLTAHDEGVIARDGAAATGDTLLGTLQSSIRGDAIRRRAADGSVSLHGCVGDQRQVEVARDAILHALAADPGLTAADVVVLCADLPRFAPYIEAVLGDPQGAPALPYVLRDRAVSRAVPLVAAVESALQLLGGRFARSSVVDLLRFAMVQRRFGLEGDDVDRIAEWSVATDVRWGLDGAHRTTIGLPEGFESGTWRRALDRLLAGIALPDGIESDPIGLKAATPGHDLERVGALCDALGALAALDDDAAEPRAMATWCGFVRELLDALFAPSFEDSASVEQLQRLLASIEDDAAGVATVLSFGEFRAMFSDRAAQVRDLMVSGPGGVTVTSLAPLRNVPFRVVVLLGVDEPNVERASAPDPAFGPVRIGDRDARADLRAALLGTVLSARSRLIVTFEAADVVSNEPVAPAAVLAELREALAEVCTSPVAELIARHPRHAHGDDNLVAGRISSAGPFSFDRGALGRALELRERPLPGRDEPTRLGAVGPPARGAIDRAELVRFLVAPQRTYLSAALGVRLPRALAHAGDELSTALDALERWRATTALVEEGLRSPDAHEDFSALAAQWASRPDGPLSSLPGRLGELALVRPDGIADRAGDLYSQVTRVCGSEPPERVEVEALLPSGDVVTAELDVYGSNSTMRWTASGSDKRARVEAAIDLFVLTVARPEVRWRSMRIWRAGKRAIAKPMSLDGVSPDQRRAQAVAALSGLTELRRLGLSEPVPLFFDVTMAMLGAWRHGDEPSARDLIAEGLGGWSPYGGRGDQDDPAVKFCFDGSYEELCAIPTRPGDPTVRLGTNGSRLVTLSLSLLECIGAIDSVSDGGAR